MFSKLNLDSVAQNNKEAIDNLGIMERVSYISCFDWVVPWCSFGNWGLKLFFYLIPVFEGRNNGLIYLLRF